MSNTPHSRFQHAVHEADEVLRDVAEALGQPDRQVAYHALKGTLAALRDRLPPDDACDLAAQLPLLVRGLYFEGYRPHGKPVKMDREAFLERVRQELAVVRPVQPERAATAALSVLARRVSAGEWAQVRHLLPADLRSLVPEPASA